MLLHSIMFSKTKNTYQLVNMRRLEKVFCNSNFREHQRSEVDKHETQALDLDSIINYFQLSATC